MGQEHTHKVFKVFLAVTHACMGYAAWRFGVTDCLVTLLLVHVSSKNEPIETFNISFESIPNNQQYDTKITYTEERKKLWQLEM